MRSPDVGPATLASLRATWSPICRAAAATLPVVAQAAAIVPAFADDGCWGHAGSLILRIDEIPGAPCTRIALFVLVWI